MIPGQTDSPWPTVTLDELFIVRNVVVIIELLVGFIFVRFSRNLRQHIKIKNAKTIDTMISPIKPKLKISGCNGQLIYLCVIRTVL